MRALLVLLAACGGITNEPGYGSALAIPGAQFRPGAFPAATGGPATQSLVTAHATIAIGHVHERLHAILDGTATAAIVGIAGADGAWIVTAGPPDVDTPGAATATAMFGLDPATEPGPFTLELAATDADGRIGEPAETALVADAAPPPDGDLVVGLVWDSTADLDLHVVDPTGAEAWSGDPNTWKAPPPGMPADPNAYLSGGWLDRDANASCHLDGAPAEHVIWKTRTGVDGLGNPVPIAPVIPSGTYIVRVDTRAMCRDASASWYVEVYAAGALVAAARGVSVPEDVLTGDHRAGAGVTALTFQR
jgi:hypothetical protein